jgi:hypothetical protein
VCDDKRTDRMRRYVAGVAGVLAAVGAAVAVAPAPAQAVQSAPAPVVASEFPTKQFILHQGWQVLASGTATFYNRSVVVSGQYKKPADYPAGYLGGDSYANTTKLGSGTSASTASETMVPFSFTIPADVPGGANSIQLSFYGDPVGPFNPLLAGETITR